jgi:hypothetical protein
MARKKRMKKNKSGPGGREGQMPLNGLELKAAYQGLVPIATEKCNHHF